MPKRRLTPKQQKAGNYYLQGHSMRQSMLLAGYNQAYADSNTCTFLHNKALAEYIRVRQQEEADAQLADAIYVKRRLMKLAESDDKETALAALKQLDAHNKWADEIKAKIDLILNEKNQQQEEHTIKIVYEEHREED